MGLQPGNRPRRFVANPIGKIRLILQITELQHVLKMLFRRVRNAHGILTARVVRVQNALATQETPTEFARSFEQDHRCPALGR